MAEFRITSEDGVLDLKRLAADLVESQGWPRDQVGIWENRGGGDVVVTVDDALLARPAGPDPMNVPVHTRSDVHRACETLRRRDPSLRGVDFADLRDEAARFFSAGWTVNDLLHALAHRYDGAPWPRGEGYEGVEWLQHRLRGWKSPRGDIRPSVSQEGAQLRVVGRVGLPEGLGLPAEEPADHRRAASCEAARAAADDARRLMRAQAPTTSDALAHRDRTAAHITRPPHHPR
ncbi:hypothetical protein ACFPZ0_06210 [Streptomonospora nanhaiensis]|uniref:Uncharacterized protein n=1 Tax=Streptomonospora nanhaiensis TaxID=1323731 RepID=A0A853BJ44_9ACTN|nr:hypothetical protein [Streptomonospora nanhaiensis]MBV2365630.1 hypothetical protein [Streptomonospora nanhaiensis]MBX9389046.1 hypothetical protein [Streptomonospora nanhaiensis]NYI95528.1 hypothetical protein [Streptomonospora nanhaiensis]